MQRNDDKESDKDKEKDREKDKVLDIDEDSNVCETVVSGKAKKKLLEKERKLSHERKPSYSSSEKSLSLMSHPLKGNAANAASINPVKMRETSSLRRQRRNSGADHKDEPHSSSGNWSASSESGRTSIGSEITVQPKSSASSTSLNHSNLHSGSGPPSSIISRRRFLNTSASSSVTSEGTATPDLQMHDLFYDDETSSAYSCDTEGYYTSFHVDSGLKTLKEEEPMTPLHSTSALSSTTSFSSTINQTVLTAESEYELFGRGSTSTTTSSAGTVCTTLMATEADRSSMHGPSPAVPERKSSLTKLNRSNSNASGGTLERSYSSSTVGSTLERTGTIKRNGVLIQKEVSAVIHQDKTETQQKPDRIDSPDSGNNTSSSPIETNSNESPTQGLRSNSEFEYSECSDLEGVDRIERIRVKTAINSSRIPSMCIITPTTSDDEAVKEITVRTREKIDLPPNEAPSSPPLPPPPQETDLDSIDFETGSHNQNNNLPKVQIKDDGTGYATIPAVSGDSLKPPEMRKDANFNNFRKTTLQPLNTMLGKLKGVLPHLKKSSPSKEASAALDISDESLYDNAGEYVTIADVRNNNNNTHKRTTGNGIYYSNDIVKRNLATVLSGNLNQETEYVSLNELPCTIRCDSSANAVEDVMASDEIDTNVQIAKDCVSARESAIESLASGTGTGTTTTSNILGKDNKGELQQKEQERKIEQEQHERQHPQIRGARVTFDAQGKVVYNSDSLKRRKGAHTTFAPGPYVKDPATSAFSSVVAATSSSPASSTSSESISAATALVSESKVIPRSPVLGGSLTRKQDIIVRPVVSQKANIVAAAATHNVDMATDVLSGRYIRDKAQLLADNRDISLAALQQPPSSIPGTTYHCTQYDAEGKRLFASTNKIDSENAPPLPPRPPRITQMHPKSYYTRTLSSSCQRPPQKQSPNALSVSVTTTTTAKEGSVSIRNVADLNHNDVPDERERPVASNVVDEIASRENGWGCNIVKRSNSYRLANSPVFLEPYSPCSSALQSSLTTPIEDFHPNSVSGNNIVHHQMGTVATTIPTNICSSSFTTPGPPPMPVSVLGTSTSCNTIDRIPIDRKDCYRDSNPSAEPIPAATPAVVDCIESPPPPSGKVAKAVTKSFERLMDEFHLSSTSIDSSYLRNKSLENFDFSDDNLNSDGESPSSHNLRDVFTHSARVQANAEAIYASLRPNRITIPADSIQHRARVLSFSGVSSSSNMQMTDIW